MNKIFILITFLLFLFLFQVNLKGNTAAFQAKQIYDDCESVSAKIDNVRFKTKDGDANIVLVGHLGKGEKKDKINKFRINQVARKLIFLGIDKKRIVIEQGVKLNGQGQVEVFYQKERIEVIKARRSFSFCLSIDSEEKRID